MTNRREFIQACIAASAVPAAAGLPWGPAFAQPASPAFYRTVFDGRYSDSVVFGAEAERLGETTRNIDGDITGLWYNEIDAQWRDQTVAIAGLTAPGPLFCLERWGWDAGLRVVFRAEHRTINGRLQHDFSGPRDLIADARALVSGPDWSTQMARLVVSCRQEICVPSKTSFAGHAGALETIDDEPLVSWVIAPVTKA